MSFSVDDARTLMLSKQEVTEETPFGPEVLVYKVLGKMFATIGFKDEIGQMNLKCDPDEAIMLRDIFDAVIPGYHMNKAQWNTVILDGSIPKGEIERMIDNSFSLVVSKMTKKDQR